MTRLPISFQSLVIQCAAVLLAALLTLFLPDVFPYQPALWHFVVIQGLTAAVFSFVLQQPRWWPPLHFIFLPAIFLTRQLDVPSLFYLVGFLLLVLFYWSTFRTRVPLYLSDQRAWKAVADLLPETRTFRFIDLGSGLGNILFYLEPRFPHGHFYGTEIAPAPWLISRLRAWLQSSQVHIFRRDYAALNLADFDVVFAFLSPAAMPGVWQQAQSQMRSGSLFISLSFSAGGRQPDHVAILAEHARHRLYVWRM